jgi:hypothetical protein
VCVCVCVCVWKGDAANAKGTRAENKGARDEACCWFFWFVVSSSFVFLRRSAAAAASSPTHSNAFVPSWDIRKRRSTRVLAPACCKYHFEGFRDFSSKTLCSAPLPFPSFLPSFLPSPLGTHTHKANHNDPNRTAAATAAANFVAVLCLCLCLSLVAAAAAAAAAVCVLSRNTHRAGGAADSLGPTPSLLPLPRPIVAQLHCTNTAHCSHTLTAPFPPCLNTQWLFPPANAPPSSALRSRLGQGGHKHANDDHV